MANVLITVDFDLDDNESLHGTITSILDAFAEVVENRNDGVLPMFGLEVDGEHREPDDPSSLMNG